MTILVDGRPFVSTSAGISSFLRGVLVAWAEACPSDRFFVALPRPTDSTFKREGLPENILLRDCSCWLSRRFPNLLWLLLAMPRLARRLKAEVFFSALPCVPYALPRGMKTLIVVHDVVNIEYKETMVWTNRLANVFFSRAMRTADILWANSNYTKERVEHYYPTRRCRDIFVGCAVDRTLFHPITAFQKDRLLDKYAIAGPYILFVGSLEPRKNLDFLLSLMPELWESTHTQLVVVGASGWKNSHIKAVVEDENFPRESVVFCGFVPEGDLVMLYNAACCFVSASLNEGFGMPQLEALLCECPVVTARNSAMIEVAEGKQGTICVAGYDRKTWMDAICKTLENRPKVQRAEFEAYDWRLIVKRMLRRLSSESRQ